MRPRWAVIPGLKIETSAPSLSADIEDASVRNRTGPWAPRRVRVKTRKATADPLTAERLLSRSPTLATEKNRKDGAREFGGRAGVKATLSGRAGETPRGVFPRRRDGAEVAAGEHIPEQADHFVVDQTVRRQHLPAVEPEWAAGEVRHLAARFLEQQDAGGGVPGIQVELPESFIAAAGHVGQVERGRAGAPHSMRAQGELVVEVNVRIVVALAAGEAGRHQRLGQIRDRRHVHRASRSEMRRGLSRRSKAHRAWGRRSRPPPAFRLRPRPRCTCPLFQSHRHAELRHSMREVGGSIERIDIPAELLLHAFARSLFAVDAVVGPDLADAGADQFLHRPVGDGHQVDIALVLRGHAGGQKFAQTRTRFAGDLRRPWESRRTSMEEPPRNRSQAGTARW